MLAIVHNLFIITSPDPKLPLNVFFSVYSLQVLRPRLWLGLLLRRALRVQRWRGRAAGLRGLGLGVQAGEAGFAPNGPRLSL